MGKILLLLLCALFFSTSARAEYPLMHFLQKDMKDNTIFGFIPACGIGSAVFPRYSFLSTALASSLNYAFSSSAPTSTTSNASECKGPKSIIVNRAPILRFVEDNIDELAEQIAHGQGEALNTLAGLMEIAEDERGKWMALLKAHFSTIVPSHEVTAGEMLDRIADVTHDGGIFLPIAKAPDATEKFKL